jgi:hypothetical protein
VDRATLEWVLEMIEKNSNEVEERITALQYEDYKEGAIDMAHFLMDKVKTKLEEVEAVKDWKEFKEK